MVDKVSIEIDGVFFGRNINVWLDHLKCFVKITFLDNNTVLFFDDNSENVMHEFIASSTFHDPAIPDMMRQTVAGEFSHPESDVRQPLVFVALDEAELDVDEDFYY